MEALGAVNLVLPFVLVVQALNAMASIGGVTIAAIRFGCGLTGPVCRLLGASGSYYSMAKDYVFWWELFAVANSVSLNLQFFCHNDGNPNLVAVINVVITALNIFLDWLFVFPMQQGVAGAAIATGIFQVVGLLVILSLPQLFGKTVVWHTFGIYEVLVLIVAAAMKKNI